VINNNLYHRFRDNSLQKIKNRYIWLPRLRLTPWPRGSFGTISVKFFGDVNGWPGYHMA